MGRRFSETERKYEAGHGQGSVRPDLDGLAARTRDLDPVRLDALYHDTPRLTLAAHRVTLRRRTGGDDEGWHLKLPAGGFGAGAAANADTRTEVHAPLGRPGGGPPDELRTEIAALVRGRPLEPVVRLRTTRRRVLLLDAAGRTLAEIAYDEVVAEPGGAAWAEIEVELGHGAPRLLDAVEERLLAAGARRSGSGSKLARALGARLVPAPRGPDPVRTAGETATAYLHAQYTAILDLDPAVRRTEEDAVHRMRVATRRARSALKSFRAELDRAATAPLGAELKWLAAALGAERDREVLAERLARRLAEIPRPEGAGTAGTAGTAAQEAARRRLTAATGGTATAGPPHTAGAPPELDDARYFALLDALEALLAHPPYTPRATAPAPRAAEATVRRDHTRLRHAVEAALALPPGDTRDTALHEARKDAKRARYSGEAAETVLGPRAAAHTGRMKSVQQLLGEHQDAVMCRTAVAAVRTAALAAGEDPAPYDAIIDRERRTAADTEAALPDLWRSADHPL
ncbi:CYTH and CHAD domain-containing protein [Streptomyces sp. V4-01]|uniref:CYTH and CHAD domain-containing protein n=1 Tax=Actinacidiphila polyblastidii TaxID=3110430 RepID=A0ABU7P850_9ACTN|nr:CYTH and CHAD domain-containing protein [Streptomyces sp. V4-01]